MFLNYKLCQNIVFNVKNCHCVGTVGFALRRKLALNCKTITFKSRKGSQEFGLLGKNRGKR
jgi:hypothetical protein